MQNDLKMQTLRMKTLLRLLADRKTMLSQYMHWVGGLTDLSSSIVSWIFITLKPIDFLDSNLSLLPKTWST